MHNLLPILLFTISSGLTPGPNNFMLMNSGMNFGIRRSMPHFWGICLGFPAMVMVVALGFGALFTQYVWIKEVLKVIGSLYMLFLAWQILQATLSHDEARVGKPFSFIQAVLFQWVNPKAWLMAVGAISLFSLASSNFHNAMAISLIYLVVLIPCAIVWLFFGSLLQRILSNDRHRKVFNILMAISLVASIALIFIE